MKAEDVQRKLESCGLILESRKRLGSDTGDQLRFKTGEILNVFDNGNISFQGKNQARVRDLLGMTHVSDSPVGTATENIGRRIFVVYGHDRTVTTQLEAMLRRWELDPLILDQLPSEGQTVIEKLEKYTEGEVSFAVVLATPDDEGHPVGKHDEKKLRVRQNVILELGLLLNKLGRARVAILLKSQHKIERPSDIQGLIYLPFTDDVAETKVQLAKEMEKQGIKISLAKL